LASADTGDYFLPSAIAPAIVCVSVLCQLTAPAV